MLDLFVGNRNYSSWSMRIGVLLRAFDISYKETLLPFGTDGIGEGSRLKNKVSPFLRLEPYQFYATAVV